MFLVALSLATSLSEHHGINHVFVENATEYEHVQLSAWVTDSDTYTAHAHLILMYRHAMRSQLCSCESLIRTSVKRPEMEREGVESPNLVVHVWTPQPGLFWKQHWDWLEIQSEYMTRSHSLNHCAFDEIPQHT